MGKLLPCTDNIVLSGKPGIRSRLGLVLFSFILFTASFLISNAVKAQVIVETFDEFTVSSSMNTATTETRRFSARTINTLGAISTTSIDLTTTAYTTSSTTAQATNSARGGAPRSSSCTTSFSTFSTQSTNSFSVQSVSTLAQNDSSRLSYTWFFGVSNTRASASRVISFLSNSSSGGHSSSSFLSVPSQSLIITPIVSQGVSTVSFWVYDPTGTGTVEVGMRTLVMAATSATLFSSYPTSSGEASTIFNNVLSAYNNNISTRTYTFSTATSSTSYTKYSTAAPGGSITGAGASNSNSGIGTDTDSLPKQIIFTIPQSLQGSSGQIVIMASGSTINIDDIEVFEAAVPGTWTGAASTDWNDINNWTYLTVPTATTDVTIPSTPNNPVLTADAVTRNLTLSASATLSIKSNTITIDGALSGAGEFIGSSTSNMVFGSNATGTLKVAPDTLNNLTLDGGANITLGAPLTIYSTGTLTIGTGITGAILTTSNSDHLNLWSDDNGSARVAQVPVNSTTGASLSTINGNVNVLCYIHSDQSANPSPIRGWRLLTAPITNFGLGASACTIYGSWQEAGINFVPGQGTMITAPASVATGGTGNGLDAGINTNYSMYTWNVSTQKLVAVSNTETGISNSTGSADNIGYFIFVRGDRTVNTITLPWLATINNTTLTCTGPLQLGDQTFTSTSGALSGAANGLSLVGNPFACSVNFSYIAGDNGTGSAQSYSGLSNILNRMYVWNSNLSGSSGVGGYICIDDADYDGNYTETLGATGTVTSADGDLNIQSGQAFFVQTQNAATASLTIKEAAKSSINNYIYRPAYNSRSAANTTPRESLRATLSLLNSDSSTSLTDGLVALYKNGYCDCVDDIDAPKFTNVDEMFALSRYGKLLCIEKRSPIDKTDTLFLTLKQTQQRNYQFNFYTAFSDHPGVGAHLEDSYTGTHTPLSMNGSNQLDFTIDGNTASKAQNRFMVVFGDVNTAPVYTDIKATKEQNTVLVQWALSNDQDMKNYVLERSTDGINYTVVDTTTAEHITGAYSWIDTDPATGTNYYRVLSTDELNEQSFSPVVSAQINTPATTSGITVFPDPIQNAQIGVAMDNMPAGAYHYQLLNDLGQPLQTGTINHAGGNSTDIIALDKTIVKGNYLLKVEHPDNSTTVINLVY